MNWQRFLMIGSIALALTTPWAAFAEAREPDRTPPAAQAPAEAASSTTEPYHGMRRGQRQDHRNDHGRGKKPSTGDVVIEPIVVGGPVRVGGIEVGAPITVGRPIVVGHSDRAVSPQPQPEVALRPSPGAVFVVPPVVLVGVAPPVVSRPDPATRTSVRTQGSAGFAASPAFQPWYALTARLMAGVPVPYTEASFSNAAVETTTPEPADGQSSYPASEYGGLAFAVTPGDAGVFVDGIYMGQTADHATAGAPLVLEGGWHSVELRLADHDTETFDVHISVGQVLPISGTLNRPDGRPAR